MRLTRVVHSVGARFLFALSIVVVASVPAMAQPFGGWISLLGYPSYHGYVAIAHNPALNFNGFSFTFEAWVSLSNNAGTCCHSIAGKNYQSNWWVGTAFDGSGRQILRSYLGTAYMDVGVIPVGTWTHIAVVYDGTRRIHYINGEKVGERVEALPSGAAVTSEMRFGSDVAWQYTPHGALNELRLWNVARTEAQIRAWINRPITVATPGLVGAWDMSGNNKVGPFDGVFMGTGIGAMTFPVTAFPCSSTATQLCLLNRFVVTMKWRTNPTPGSQPDGDAQLAACANPGSGVFYFFDPNVWEALVKVVNGCGVNNRYWVFSAATTDVFYRMEVMDIRAGQNRIYFNWPGAAQALIDTDAFQSCP